RWIPSLEFLTIFTPALFSFLPQRGFYTSSVCDCGSSILPCLYTPNDGYYADPLPLSFLQPPTCDRAWNLYHDSPA
ncbi:hypothetical protein BJ165DRAFT_1511455, partial [Panaeolus papilionaceus]